MTASVQPPLYLFVFRAPHPMPAQTPEEMQQVLNKWMAWMQELKARNCFQGVNRLERTGQVVRGPDASVTDGPFVEAKEIVGGYLIVSAGSQAEATQLARGCPVLAYGGAVEVRPVMTMPAR
ncbi:MAG TPA: YciI family protein [Lacunisphaera sp.]|nr:YciI family protein [Lacunisphaera sp.]